MDKKILNQKLIKSLINSDFFLIEQQKPPKKNFQPVSVTNKTNNKQRITALDPFEVAKDLKQIIRTFYFIKNSNHKLKLNFFFDTENIILSELIFLTFKNENLLKDFLIDINAHKISKTKRISSRVYSNISFVIDKFHNDNFLKKQLKKNFRLFFLLNPENNLKYDCYNIQNNLTNYKKTLYFLSFLKQLLLNIVVRRKS